MENKKYIHSSWNIYNLYKFFEIYNKIIENMNILEMEYKPKEEENILNFLKYDITNVKMLYIRYFKIDSKFNIIEEKYLEKYIKNNNILPITYSLTSKYESNRTSNKIILEEDNIWSPLLKELIFILSSKLYFIHFEKNKLFSKSIINNITPNTIMKYNYDLKDQIINIYDMIYKLYEFKSINLL
jgi:hypothetical protein